MAKIIQAGAIITLYKLCIFEMKTSVFRSV